MGEKLNQMKAAAKKGPSKPSPARAKKPPHPVRRDNEIQKRGRFPHGTAIDLVYAAEPNIWTGTIGIARGGETIYSHTETNEAIHALLTALYRRWIEAGKPGEV